MAYIQSAARNSERLPAAGEMVFPWMFDDFAALAPLRGAAEALAAKADWPRMYSTAALAGTTTPIASATYFEDMYVDMQCAQVRRWPCACRPGSCGWCAGAHEGGCQRAWRHGRFAATCATRTPVLLLCSAQGRDAGLPWPRCPAQETAARIRGLRQWVTSEYMHSGIRDDGARIFEHLLAMVRGNLPLY